MIPFSEISLTKILCITKIGKYEVKVIVTVFTVTSSSEYMSLFGSLFGFKQNQLNKGILYTTEIGKCDVKII